MPRITVKDLIKQSGYNQKWLAEEMRMTRTCLTNKVNGWSGFSDTELASLAEILDVNERLLRRALPQRKNGNGASASA